MKALLRVHNLSCEGFAAMSSTTVVPVVLRLTFLINRRKSLF
jgi:hypothetical protein